MQRINLRVPYEEKDEVKALGAKWDWKMKLWYIPEDQDSDKFTKWRLYPNLKADSFSIAMVETDCWSCGNYTEVNAIFFHDGYHFLDYDEDTEEIFWERNPLSAMLCVVEHISQEAYELITNYTLGYTFDYSRKRNQNYVMNHCIFCRAKQGDYDMHGEPGGEFNPVTAAGAKRIRIISFDKKIECRASDSYYNSYYKTLKYKLAWNKKQL